MYFNPNPIATNIPVLPGSPIIFMLVYFFNFSNHHRTLRPASNSVPLYAMWEEVQVACFPQAPHQESPSGCRKPKEIPVHGL